MRKAFLPVEDIGGLSEKAINGWSERDGISKNFQFSAFIMSPYVVMSIKDVFLGLWVSSLTSALARFSDRHRFLICDHTVPHMVFGIGIEAELWLASILRKCLKKALVAMERPLARLGDNR